MTDLHFILAFTFSTLGVIVGGHLIDGIFTQPTLVQGYNLVATIPAGATNLNVTELRHTNNYLAVRLQDGSFLLNGNYNINWSGAYKAAGTTFVYHRQTHQQLESFEAIGPLQDPIDVMVLYQEPNPGIVYRYIVPSNLKDEAFNNRSGRGPISLYHHKVYEIPPSKGKSSMIGDEALPSSTKRLRKRKFGWRTVGFTICSKTCGGGIQTKSHICIREHTQVQVPPKRCHNIEKPADVQLRCNVGPCPPRWRTSTWSTCSVTCGSGIRSRDLECIQEVNSQLTVRIADGACVESISPPVTEICEMPICKNVLETIELNVPVAHWNVGNWSQCSTSCGPGRRTRTVNCSHHSHHHHHHHHQQQQQQQHSCSIDDKPIESEVCDLGACIKTQDNNSVDIHEAQWLYTEWTRECSVECGTGIQTRRIFCNSLSPNESCNIENHPEPTRICSTNRSCSGRWFTGPWSDCVTSCGNGEQTREVVCVTTIHGALRVVLDMNCPAEKPETQKPCIGPPCPASWFISDWDECTKSCGRGLQTRLVKCLNSESNLSSMIDATCNAENQPISKRSCNKHSCRNSIDTHDDDDDDDDESQPSKQFQNDPEINDDLSVQDKTCKDTMSNCGLVIQARLCTYPFYRKVCCYSCFRTKYDVE